MPRAVSRRRNRAGNYSMFLGFLMPVFIGFAALSVDVGWMRIAESQAQDVADAAAFAALIELRRTGSTADAEDAAEYVQKRNIIGGKKPELTEMRFGNWERGGEFIESSFRPNAVQAKVGRYTTSSGGGVDMQFARIWGYDDVSVEGDAVAASRSLHVVLVMDITGSFAGEIKYARQAALAFLDILEDVHGDYDKMGMAVFTYRFANEWTPMFDLDNPVAVLAARTQWGLLNVASKKTGADPSCTDRGDGKYPQMPREYCDEPGTDHHVGLIMARQMFTDETDPFAYRAAVLLTDGQPNGLDDSSQRDDADYVEERWREYAGPVPHSRTEIETATVVEAQKSWTNERIHTWTVTFRAENAFLKDTVQGDGAYYYTTNPDDLVPIFEEIANSLPLLIVE